MINFKFDAEAYKASMSHELIPEGQYRAKVKNVTVKSMADGTVMLMLDLVTTYRNMGFTAALFLNPVGHMYYEASNKRFGDMCVSCKVSPFDVMNDETKLIGCVCGIEIVHKKSKDGNAEFNTVKKFLNPVETERLREFDSGNFNKDVIPEAIDMNDPTTWFGGNKS